MLKYYLFILALLMPSAAHATIYWDDEMEGTVNGVWYNPTSGWFTGATPAYTHDTGVKYSGTASVRMNFYQNCDINNNNLQGQCGGAISRVLPGLGTPDLYVRYYWMKSGNRAITTTNGFFKSGFTATKIIRYVGDNVGGDESKGWFNLGNNYGQNLIISMENVPTVGAATDRFTSAGALADNTWYCMEYRVKMNTNGAANGIAQAWVENTQVLNLNDVIWQRAGQNKNWRNVAMVRQNGWGTFYFDRIAAGDQRIGCIGSPPLQDTTNPNPPTNLQAN